MKLEPFNPPPQALPTRNSEVLKSFVAYCEAHPHERFWQALRNWTQYQFIYVSNDSPYTPLEETILYDTFFWEGRNG